jgi:multicomponent Na+:H+ antiporter subunit E
MGEQAHQGGKIPAQRGAEGTGRKTGRWRACPPTFLVLLAFWLVFSGKFDFFHVGLGVLSCALVTFLCVDLLFTPPDAGTLWRFIRYTPWLLYQVLLSSLHLTRLTFHPRLHDLIHPQIIRFRSRLSGNLPLFIFANSITLTPGTITIFVNTFGEFTVHAVDREVADALPGEMEERIAAIFAPKA